MEFLELAKKRCSVRRYQPRQVEEEKLQRILEAARIAPTAANKQPQYLIVVRDSDGLQRLQQGANTYQAPLVIVVCADRDAAWVRPSDKKDMVDTDASIVATHMILEAAELGLGSCWIAYFDPEIIRKECHLPSNLEPVCLLSLGYANGKIASPDRHEKQRKPLSDMVQYGLDAFPE